MVRIVKSTFLSPVNSPSKESSHRFDISNKANSNTTQKRPNCHEVTEQTATSPGGENTFLGCETHRKATRARRWSFSKTDPLFVEVEIVFSIFIAFTSRIDGGFLEGGEWVGLRKERIESEMKVCREEERGEEEGIEWIKDLSVHFEDLALRSSFVAEERNSCGDEFWREEE
ncbi:hypothetical protein OIU76_004100 [Salix suchowensis]|nr:hypothetical protein OIU76_004100 [Salix suchowensis]